MKIIILGMVVLGVAFAVTPSIVNADTTRGCNAEYRLRYLLVDGGKLTSPKTLHFGKFTSVGRCRNSLYANDCRRKAREYATQCFNAHWAKRWDRATPGECVGGRGGVGLRDYRVADLKTAIEREICFGAGSVPFSREVVVEVQGVTWGGKRCSREISLTTTYKVNPKMCAAVDWKGAGGE
jgi:hypothetical protein